MPASKDDWGFVGAVNRKEFDVKVKWLLQHQPQHPEAQAVQETLQKPALPLTPIPAHMLPEGAIVTPMASTSSGGPKRHRHRHHRKSCPRHLKHLVDANEELMKNTAEEVMAGRPSAAVKLRRLLDATAALEAEGREDKMLLNELKPKRILPTLHVPQVVGKGMAMFLTGSYCECADQWDKRPTREYPNYEKLSRPIALNDPHANLEVGADKLIKIPVDKRNCRRKDELKTHHELSYTTGKSMMRGS